MKKARKEVVMNFGEREIRVEITKIGECWWNLKDLCNSLCLDIELEHLEENQDNLDSITRKLKLGSNNIRVEAGETETKIMLSFPGLERLVDYAGESAIANAFCEWMTETAFPLIWRSQQEGGEKNEEDTLIKIKPQNQNVETRLVAA